MSLALLVTHIVSFYVLIYYLPIRSYGRKIEVGRTYYNENVFFVYSYDIYNVPNIYIYELKI